MKQAGRRKKVSRGKRLKPAYKTTYGSMYHCEFDEFSHSPQFNKLRKKVQLVFTSPPYPLQTKKKYGNLNGHAYSQWLSKYAASLTELTKRNGSIVIEIGNAWERGVPTMSVSVLEGLLGFLKAGGCIFARNLFGTIPPVSQVQRSG